MAKLGVPGAIGAFLGATVLSSLSTEHAAPLMAAILLGIGVYVLLRFSMRTPLNFGGVRGGPVTVRSSSPRWVCSVDSSMLPVVAAGGAGDHQHAVISRQDRAAHRDRSVSASEFLVSVSASLGFLVGLRQDFLDHWPVVVG